MWAIWLVSLNFTVHAEILLRACADQLLYNLSLIRLCSACVKQNKAVKTASNACSLLAKQKLSDLVGKGHSSLIVNFEQVKKTFLVLIIYLTFFLPVVECAF